MIDQKINFSLLSILFISLFSFSSCDDLEETSSLPNQSLLNNNLVVHSIDDEISYFNDSFGYNTGGWTASKNPRMSADVNGDGKADLIGFGDAGVYVSLSNGTSSTYRENWVNWTPPTFTVNGGWEVSKHPRAVADVNGDGKADLIGFGNEGVFVALSTGSEFTYREAWYTSSQNTFCVEGGWDVSKHPREVADVNGDGKADIIGFGNDEVVVALSTGTGFSYRQPWYTSSQSTFCFNGGWEVSKHPRTIADVNGDGKADIVGFGNDEVFVALSTGTGFSYRQPWYTSSQSTFCFNGSWEVSKHPRTVADVNGDGNADIVGFGNEGVFVAYSNGSSFQYRQLWSNNFGYNDGWDVILQPRVTADVNGDGKSDIIGFDLDGVYVTFSNL
ncbi:hypothetical protein GCM10011506_16920 [Marivirga lumbricoides]|uniref:VCBS repeat-containing protein n=1 Tax=Marivirga lumbricoides TaxID=1046115 RepID=A0ABQ1M1F4_9BACT|nr:hypothetical protein GCM10011506_16920 [Marivirga lumbricoides]